MGATSYDDTIAALSSGRPPAAIAIVRCSGGQAFKVAEAIAGPLPPVRHASWRTLRDPDSGTVLDQALVLAFGGPSTATGEDIVEFHCHGGRATVDAVLSAILAHPGCRAAEPGEFTRRALANGRIDLTEAEGLADLLSAETELQRRSAMARAGGAFRKKLEDWRTRLLALAASAEVAIDYSDEEDGQVDADLKAGISALQREITALLDSPRVEPLRDGVRVVIAGPPNVGKSSLINVISGSERAIVTPIAGTTRDVIEVPVSVGGIPYVFVDTAGLRESDDVVEGIGVERAEREVKSADILLWMGEASDAPESSILVAGKADLGSNGFGLAVSSVTGEGVSTLLEAIGKRARSMLPKGDEIALERRQHELLASSAAALERAGRLVDPVLIAEELRVGRSAIDNISGRAGVEDLLDALFGKFCLGK